MVSSLRNCSIEITKTSTEYLGNGCQTYVKKFKNWRVNYQLSLSALIIINSIKHIVECIHGGFVGIGGLWGSRNRSGNRGKVSRATPRRTFLILTGTWEDDFIFEEQLSGLVGVRLSTGEQSRGGSCMVRLATLAFVVLLAREEQHRRTGTHPVARRGQQWCYRVTLVSLVVGSRQMHLKLSSLASTRWTIGNRIECMKMFEFAKFQNMSVFITLNIAIQLVGHSIWPLFFEANELSHIKSVNEVTGKSYTFSEVRIISRFDWLRNERMMDWKWMKHIV